MRMILFLALFAALPASSPSAPTSLSVGNSLRYALSETNEEILEDYFDVDLTRGSFLARLRYEAFQPSEEKRDREGVVFRAAGVATRWATLWVGDFYELFGRGIAFHGYEDRDLRVDTSLDGLRLGLEGARGSLKAFSGRTPGKTTVFHGIDGEARLASWAFLGGSYVSRRPTSTTGYVSPDLELGVGRAGVRVEPWRLLGVTLGPSEVYLEGGERSKGEARDRGRGLFLSGGTVVAGAAVGVEYKDYSHMSLTAEGREYASPPPATLEHGWTLLARHAHELDANDEEGFLGRVEWQPVPMLGLTAAYVTAERQDGEPLLIEAMVETRVAERLATPLAVVGAWTEESLGTVVTASGTLEDTRRHLTVGGEVSFPLRGAWSGRLTYEHQHTEGDAVGEFDLDRVEAELSRAPGLSLAMVGEFSNVSDVQRGLPWLKTFADETAWFSLQGVIDVAAGHQVRVMVGSRPEGKVCAGGACRKVPAFKGIEVIATSVF